jgi:hypothetical protein
MNKIILFFYGTIIFSLIIGCNQKKENTPSIPIEKHVESFAAIYAKESNEQCPIKMENNMILTHVEATNENAIIHHFTVPDHSINLIDGLKYHNFRSLYNLAYAKDQKPLRDNQITLIYQYHNNKGDLLYEIVNTPQKYNQFRPSDNDIRMYMEEMERSYKILTPIKYGKDLILIKFIFEKPNTLIYHYKMDKEAKDISVSLSKALENLKWEDLLILMDHKITFRYIFYDRNDTYVQIIDLTPEKYQKLLKEMAS